MGGGEGGEWRRCRSVHQLAQKPIFTGACCHGNWFVVNFLVYSIAAAAVEQEIVNDAFMTSNV